MLRGRLELFRMSATRSRLEVGVVGVVCVALAVFGVLLMVAESLDDDAILFVDTEVASIGTAATLTLVVTKAGGPSTGTTKTLVVTTGGESYVAMVKILVELVGMELMPF